MIHLEREKAENKKLADMVDSLEKQKEENTKQTGTIGSQ